MRSEDSATRDALMKSIVVLVFVVSATGIMFFALFALSTRQFSPLQESRGITGGAYSNIPGNQAIISVPVQSSLRITTLQPDIPPASAGEVFSFEFSASGGKEPYVWSLEQPSGSGYSCMGRLPEGLVLSATGTLSGIPGAQETCLVGIKVSSFENGGSAKADFAVQATG